MKVTFLADVLFAEGVAGLADTGVLFTLTLVLDGDADFYLRFLSNNSFFLSMTRVVRSNFLCYELF